MFFQENSLGVAISQHITGTKMDTNKHLDRIFYNYDEPGKKFVEVTLDSMSLNAAIDYYADIFQITQAPATSRDQIRANIRPHPTGVSLKGFYSHNAKATISISVGADVLIGEDNWLCRINRIIQHKVTVNDTEHTTGNFQKCKKTRSI